MDRGRAGGFVTDNNLSMKQIKEKQFKEHLDRLEKIKKRRAGSSNTLDNNPPVIVKAALTNPRKIALRNEFNVVVEKENKSLLKRISMILTAPPTITTKDYYEMKKLCAPGTVDAKEAFENKLREDKTKKFFESIKHVKPVYSARQWEDDYKKQRFNQKFMRQVKYRRPKDFVDPFKPDEPTSAESPEHNRAMRQSFNSRAGLSSRASNTSESFAMTDRSHGEEEGEPEQASPRDADPAVKKSKSASHVDRIRAVKSQKNAPGPVRKGGKKQASSSSSSSTTLNLPRTKSESNNDDDGHRDELENDRDADDDGVGYEQDFEDNGGRGEEAAAVTVTLVEVDPYGTDDFEETDASAALAAAAAAGPRQQSSRGQRRPHSERRKSEEYEYDDGFEPVTEEEQRAIAVVVFAGDDEYSHDGFFGEETPAAASARRAEAEAVATEDEAPTDYEADGDFVEAPTDGESRPAAGQAAGAASEVDTDIDQPTATNATSRSSRDRSNDTYRHKKKTTAPKKTSSSDAPRPRPAEETAPSASAAPSSSEGHSSSGGHRHSPPKHGKHSHSSRKAGSSSESREKHRHAHHRDAAHSEATGSSSGGSGTTKDAKAKRPPRNDDDDYAGLVVEERKSSIVTIARPIKLMREVMAAHHPMALASSPTAAHANNHHASNATTTGNGSLTHKARDGFDLQVSYMDASIECCLVNQETLLITVQGVNTEVPFQADAVISEQDLATICDLPAMEEDEAVETVRADNVDAALAKPARMILRDLDALTSIATEIVENIELRMDYGSEPRIILNLIHEIDPEEGVQASALMMHPATGKGGAAGASSMAGGASAAGGFGFAGGPASPGAQMVGGMPRTQSFAASATPFNVVADEDVEEILLSEKADVLVLTGGARLPLHFNVQNQSLAISNINKLIEYAKQQQRVEHVYVLYRAHVVNEEQLRVVATVTSSSVKTFKRTATASSSGGSGSGSGGTTGGANSRDTQKPQLAVSPPQTLRFTMPLPSVVQLDPELFADFAANVVQSLKIEHDTRTGVNTLLMHTPA